jgi:DNA-binding transcriptional regulator LsrR (DeoR family)
LSYAWNNDCCFPGQNRLAEDMGMSRSRVTEYVSELDQTGLITIQRRGQGRTNIYTVHSQVKSKPASRQTSRSRPADI